MFYLLLKDLPCCYEITFDGTGLIISIDRDAWAGVSRFLVETAPLIASYQETLKLSAFISPEQDAWGFGPALVRQPSNTAEAIIYRCDLPTAKRNQESGGPNGMSVLCTLSALFAVLDCVEENMIGTSAGKPTQLVCISVSKINRDLGNCPISAVLAPKVTQWMQATGPAKGDMALVDVRDSMKTAHEVMLGRKNDPPERFLALMSRGQLLLQCPGDACTLSSGYSSDGTQGSELHPHNVDNVIQALTLCVGMATFHSRLRAAGV